MYNVYNIHIIGIIYNNISVHKLYKSIKLSNNISILYYFYKINIDNIVHYLIINFGNVNENY